jgi:hypothetical protein
MESFLASYESISAGSISAMIGLDHRDFRAGAVDDRWYLLSSHLLGVSASRGDQTYTAKP